MNKIVERIEREAGIPGLVSAVVERISRTDLQSILLEVYRQLARNQQPAAVLSAYETNRFVRPAAISPLDLLAWERTAFSMLPSEFEAVILSPVAPLGTCSAIALVDQNKVLSTIRNTEVVADSTNVMALECALRRKNQLRTNPKSKAEVHLAASHRLLRTQQYQGPNLLSHFSVFGLCSAGRNQGGLTSELAALRRHIGVYLRALRAYLGADVGLRVALTDFGALDRTALLADQVFAPLQAEFMDVDCVMDSERTGGRDYYRDLCFHVYATGVSGRAVELADGGLVNWTQRLLNNAKEWGVISAIGSERVCAEFRSAHEGAEKR